MANLREGDTVAVPDGNRERLQREIRGHRSLKPAAPMADTPPLPTDIPLNCPYCGRRLVNVPADRAIAYYECATDGLLMLTPDGRLRRVERADPPP